MTDFLGLKTLPSAGAGGTLWAPDDCVVLGAIILEGFADAREEMADIRVSETEAEEKNLLGHELTGQHLKEARPFAAIEFVVVLCDDDFGWVIDGPVHLVEDRMRP